MTEEQPFRIFKRRGFRNPSLIVAWSYDAGGIAASVIDFLDKKLNLEVLAEITPERFFPLGGVKIEEDIIIFPESRFYYCQVRNILIFESDTPSHEHYKFLNAILDFAVDHCKVKKLYTIGGIISPIAHTSPRRVAAVVNQPELKRVLGRYDVRTNVDYQTPSSGRPTLNSFLLWVAKRRDIAGSSLWVEVPFYLAAVGDPIASKCMLGVLNRRFKLSLDFEELDLEIEKLNKDIEELKSQNPEINRYIEMLERGIALDEGESETLAKEVAEFIQKRR